MKIPSGIRHFPNSALFVTVDQLHAKGYLVKGDEAHNVFSIEVPAEGYDGIDAGNPNKNLQPHVFHDHVLKAAMSEIAKQVAAVSEIFIFIPAKLESVFETGLTSEMRKKVVKIIQGEMIHETPVELAKRLTL
ncbi:MAG: hypothetical protein WCJ29_02205 [bacterium]